MSEAANCRRPLEIAKESGDVDPAEGSICYCSFSETRSWFYSRVTQGASLFSHHLRRSCRHIQIRISSTSFSASFPNVKDKQQMTSLSPVFSFFLSRDSKEEEMASRTDKSRIEMRATIRWSNSREEMESIWNITNKFQIVSVHSQPMLRERYSMGLKLGK